LGGAVEIDLDGIVGEVTRNGRPTRNAGNLFLGLKPRYQVEVVAGLVEGSEGRLRP
jgi:hypothetical protein